MSLKSESEAAAPTILEELRMRYDPTGKGRRTKHALYNDQALLAREAIRFDREVRNELERIWKLVDVNGNGIIDFDEYKVMHHKLFVLHNAHPGPLFERGFEFRFSIFEHMKEPATSAVDVSGAQRILDVDAFTFILAPYFAKFGIGLDGF